MNGNLARSILCSLVTSVDFGWYSSIVGVCCFCGDWPCCVIAARGQTTNAAAAEAATKNSGNEKDGSPGVHSAPWISASGLSSHRKRALRRKALQTALGDSLTDGRQPEAPQGTVRPRSGGRVKLRQDSSSRLGSPPDANENKGARVPVSCQ